MISGQWLRLELEGGCVPEAGMVVTGETPNLSQVSPRASHVASLPALPNSEGQVSFY